MNQLDSVHVAADADYLPQANVPSSANQPALGALIMTAALALPGVHSSAHAETVPERGAINVRYLRYSDSQPGLDRISVDSPSLSVMVPIAGEWTVEGSLVSDHVSGASPRYHTAISGASRMQDERKAGDVQVSRYFQDGKISVGAAYSTEHDYVSRALSFSGSVSSESKNTTWNFGIGVAKDDINPVNLNVVDEHKNTWDAMLGVSQILTPRDIVQLNLSFSRGRGYFSDPYKLIDNRPRERNQSTLTFGWNHHFDAVEGTSRLSYRYYSDSYKIRAHTFTAEYVQPFANGWTVTPSIRLYSQRAASFYFDPVYDPTLGAPFPPGYVIGSTQYVSADQRLAAFGARTLGIRIAKQLTSDWTVDVKYEHYEQRSSWRWFGDGSPGLAPLSAHSLQIGLMREF